MELLAGRLGDLALSELVGDLTQDPVKGRLGDRPDAHGQGPVMC
jgi:hypothetical protein